MTPKQLKLGRRRLWLGITNVGFRVVKSSAGQTIFCPIPSA